MPRRRGSPKDSQSRANRKRSIRSEIFINPRTDGQNAYVNVISNHVVTICNGVAGTGKTHLAVGMALKLMQDHPDVYKRIIIARPAIPTRGENLGFLPGTLEEKMGPFVRPIWDNLCFFLNVSEVQHLMDYGIIEICPIAFMRGRTFDNCILIVDEAQNCSIEQAKMILTRIGKNTKAIIEGDVRQSDIDGENINGLRDIMERHRDVEGVGIISLTGKDIQRSEVVNRILERY